MGRLEEVESHITFSLRIRRYNLSLIGLNPMCLFKQLLFDPSLCLTCLSLSKNSVNPSSKEVSVQVQVKAEATLEIRG